MPISDQVLDALSQYIRKAYQEAKELAYNDTIRTAIQMEDAHLISPNRAEASIFVRLKDAPEARAYEFGSGLHDQRGGRLYAIAATERSSVRDKNGNPQLAFWWEREKKWFVGPQLPHGHPGVAPAPYLRPAMINNIPFLRQQMREVVKQAVTATIRNSFRQIYRGHP